MFGLICLFVYQGCTFRNGVGFVNYLLVVFDRFVARRGFCSEVFTNCGTNFVSAKRYLSDILGFFTNFLEVPLNRFDCWQFLQRASQHFWRRWSEKYLHSFKKRSKWASIWEDLGTCDLVVIIDNNVTDNNAPPLHSRLDRIDEVHPGMYGVVRVATVRTSNGVQLRPVVKLCPLLSAYYIILFCLRDRTCLFFLYVLPLPLGCQRQWTRVQ